MKKLLNSFIGMAIFFSIFFVIPGIAGTLECTYKMNGEVIAKEEENILIIDKTGNVWSYDTEKFYIGDKVEITFCNNFTENTRKDDKIEKLKKI